MTTDRKRLVIKLPDRHVRIYEDEWPIIAETAAGDYKGDIKHIDKGKEHRSRKYVEYIYCRVWSPWPSSRRDRILRW